MGDIDIGQVWKESEEERERELQGMVRAQEALAAPEPPAPNARLPRSGGQSSLSVSGGVPGHRDPVKGRRIKELNKQRQEIEGVLGQLTREEAPQAYDSAVQEVAVLDARIRALNEPSAALPKDTYATGNRHGIMVMHDKTGKIKQVVYMSGDGVVRTPTLEEAVNGMIVPVTDKASKDANAVAGQNFDLFMAEFQRRGASPDSQAFIGEHIQRTLEDRALGQLGVKGRPNSVQLQNDTAANSAMKAVFKDFKLEDLSVESARTVGPEENAQMSAIQETAINAYEELKTSPELANGKGNIKAAVLSAVVTEHKQALEGFGKNGAKEAIDTVVRVVDAARGMNLQQEVARGEARVAQERKAFIDTGLADIGRVVGTGSPHQIKQTLEQHAGLFLEADNADKLVNVVGSSIGAQRVQEALGVVDATFGQTNLTPSNTQEEQQWNLVARGVVGMIMQTLKQARPDEHHVYADIVGEMSGFLQRGSEGRHALFTKYPDVGRVITTMKDMYTQGVNIDRVAELKRKRDLALSQRTRQEGSAAHLANLGYWSWDRKRQRMIPKKASNPAEQRRKLRGMNNNDELTAKLDSSLGLKISDQIAKVTTQDQLDTVIKTVIGARRSGNTMYNVQQTNPALTTPDPTGGSQSTNMLAEQEKSALMENLKTEMAKGQGGDIRGAMLALRNAGVEGDEIAAEVGVVLPAAQ
jgi:hypothetical protein